MHNLNRIQLNGLRAVEAVGRLGTLRAAADEIGVTPGAVSQQLVKTERQLGRTLFLRRPKGLTLTPHGEAVMRHLNSGMAALSAAVAVAERRQENTLTISAAPVFAGKWLVWRLKDFNEKHPDIRVRVDATMSLVDPDFSDVDAGIRVGRGQWPGVNASKLVDQRALPVCSPAIAERLNTPRDLASVPIIRDAGEMFGWDIWLKPNGLDEGMLGDGPNFSDASLCLDAAVAGQGAFLAWESIAADALKAGRLVAPFPGRFPTGFAFWFVTGTHTRKSQNVRAFEAWLRGEMETAVDAG